MEKQDLDVQRLRAELSQFHESIEFYRLPPTASRYTEGVRHLAERADCHWLVQDACIIALGLMQRKSFVTVDFLRLSETEQKRTGFEASIRYTDGNGTLLQVQKYLLADFPFDTFRLFYVHRILMLPGEY